MAPRYTLERIRAIAAARGGECLSDECRGVKAAHRWRCAQGHEWNSRLVNVAKKGSWCRVCASERLSQERRADNIRLAREHATQRGGECLATANFTTTERVKWRCSLGHEWAACFRDVCHGNTWCPVCDRAKRHVQVRTLADAQRVALERGGRCLSQEFVNTSRHLIWMCAEGHEWPASYSSVARIGSWCPNCRYVGETMCGEVLQTMFPDYAFVRNRRGFDWLVDAKGKKRVQLDYWCERLRLAVECQGSQHTTVVPIFHPNGEEDLARQKRRDESKRDQCEAAWVCLVEVPHTVFERVPYPRRKESIARFLWNAIASLGYPEDAHCSLDTLLGTI